MLALRPADPSETAAAALAASEAETLPVKETPALRMVLLFAACKAAPRLAPALALGSTDAMTHAFKTFPPLLQVAVLFPVVARLLVTALPSAKVRLLAAFVMAEGGALSDVDGMLLPAAAARLLIALEMAESGVLSMLDGTVILALGEAGTLVDRPAWESKDPNTLEIALPLTLWVRGEVLGRPMLERMLEMPLGRFNVVAVLTLVLGTMPLSGDCEARSEVDDAESDSAEAVETVLEAGTRVVLLRVVLLAVVVVGG